MLDLNGSCLYSALQSFKIPLFWMFPAEQKLELHHDWEAWGLDPCSQQQEWGGQPLAITNGLRSLDMKKKAKSYDPNMKLYCKYERVGPKTQGKIVILFVHSGFVFRLDCTCLLKPHCFLKGQLHHSLQRNSFILGPSSPIPHLFIESIVRFA